MNPSFLTPVAQRRVEDANNDWDRYDCILSGGGLNSNIVNIDTFQHQAIVTKTICKYWGMYNYLETDLASFKISFSMT